MIDPTNPIEVKYNEDFTNFFTNFTLKFVFLRQSRASQVYYQYQLATTLQIPV